MASEEAKAAAEQAWAIVAGEAKAASERAWAIVGGATGQQRCQRRLGGWRVGASVLEMQCVRAAGHDGLCSLTRTCTRDVGAGLECLLVPGHEGECVAGEAFDGPAFVVHGVEFSLLPPPSRAESGPKGAPAPPDPLTLARAAVERASEWRAASFGGDDYAAAMKAEQGAIALLARVEADVEKRAGVRASREWRDMERVVLEEVGALGEAGRVVSERIAARLRADGGEVRR